jgi:hypothetical protein
LFAAAEHAVAADRFARKIVRFLTICAARLRQLNAIPLGCRMQRDHPQQRRKSKSSCITEPSNGIS